MKALLALIIYVTVQHDVSAKINCPPMPETVSQLSRDVKSSIDLAVGSVAKVKAGEISVKTEVSAKNLFERFPNADKVVIVQMMAATYCAMLSSNTNISSSERDERWVRFQDKILTYAIPATTPGSGQALEQFRALVQPLYFSPGGSTLLPESVARLREYVSELKRLPFESLVLEGHTGAVNPTANTNLSLQRAVAVEQYLAAQGIDRSRMRATGAGARKPIYPGDNAYNSRVEIKLFPQ